MCTMTNFNWSNWGLRLCQRRTMTEVAAQESDEETKTLKTNSPPLSKEDKN